MIIQTKNIGIEISGKTIFSNISLEINPNEMMAITGPSGSGKTTLLNCLGLIQSVNSGDILIENQNASKWKEKEKTSFWKDKAAFIYQDYGIIEDENISYNVTLNKQQAKAKIVEEILHTVGLGERGQEMAAVLSGGEKQRLGVARAIYKKASIIYADEPTASLDQMNREVIINLLRKCSENGASVIIATHDERLVSVCDRSINLNPFM
ncbi:ABC transporter ATP-binding protein [Lysinibacillus varians]|uniref:ATP-binding cassette domain-containing protein n=1 Tax=Lysinibacillus varians TaxID=1145276 RepID=A0ABY2T9F3_9BACI|nr:ATP-binding cassette domain-containing protein [Lysinibacillus varians]AHN22511.1 membrane protein [Lysinibacillus varians]TKI61168.1 ATP-binding cassette domain-containing protein [Lysinibacillus varians]